MTVSSAPITLRVAILVTNDMRHDSRVQRTAATLAADGHHVTVYAVLNEATAGRFHEDADGYTIVRVPMLTRPADVGRPLTGAARARRRIPSPKELAAGLYLATRPAFGGTLHLLLTWIFRWRSWGARVEAQAEPADVWHANDLSTLQTALACARRYGGEVVYDSHEIFTEAGAIARLPAAVRRVIRRLERGWAERCAAVLTVNESVAAYLSESLGLSRIDVVHNCATQPDGAASPHRAPLGLGADDQVILYHGSMTTGRGLETLVMAMELPSLATAHLAFMGYGPLRPQLQLLAEASPASARIQFLPPVAPAVLTAWVAGADVAAMPIEPSTLNHRLSSPNKLFEALAAGVPVVGPDLTEFRRIVLDGPLGHLGTLHRGHAAADIAAAISEVLSRGELEAAELRERCRRAANSRWSWEREQERLRAVYARLDASSSPVEAELATPLAGLSTVSHNG